MHISSSCALQNDLAAFTIHHFKRGLATQYLGKFQHSKSLQSTQTPFCAIWDRERGDLGFGIAPQGRFGICDLGLSQFRICHRRLSPRSVNPVTRSVHLSEWKKLTTAATQQLTTEVRKTGRSHAYSRNTIYSHKMVSGLQTRPHLLRVSRGRLLCVSITVPPPQSMTGIVCL